MSKQFIFSALVIILIFVSCKNEKKQSEQELTNTNFFINEKNPKKAWEEFEPSDTIAIKTDDNLAVKVKVGEEVVFKDASEPSNAVSDREWDFDMDAEANSTEPIAKFTFQSPGLYEVKLSVNGKYTVSKMILALGSGDENIISVNQVAKVEDLNKVNSQPSSTTSTSTPVQVSKPVEKTPAPVVSSATKATPPSPSPSPVPTQPTKSVNPELTTGAKTKVVTPPPPTPAKPIETSKPMPSAPIATKEVPKAAPPPPVQTKKEEPKAVTPATTSTPTTVVAKPQEVAESKFKAADKAGANSKSKGEDEGAWVDKVSAVLTPHVKCKLSELVIFCNNSGKLKFSLRNNQNGQSYTMSSNVIKGKSQVILEEFDDMILEPGNSYTLNAESDGSAKIENAQGATMRENPKLKVDNKGSTSFFDLKFRY